MKNKVIQISTRDFLRDFADVTQKPQAQYYSILRYGKPVGIFTPVIYNKKKKKSISIEDLASAGFQTSHPTLSEEIDNIIYGTKK